jgi:hypothetical protein
MTEWANDVVKTLLNESFHSSINIPINLPFFFQGSKVGRDHMCSDRCHLIERLIF